MASTLKSSEDQDGPARLTLAPAGADDAADLWAWRNDPVTRAMSLAADDVSWDAHQVWFAKSLADPLRILFIGRLSAGDKVGMCRFDLDPARGVAEASLNLNPAHRGKGLSSPLLSAALALVLDTGPMEVIARIKAANTASRRCFERSGFRFDHAEGEILHLIYRP